MIKYFKYTIIFIIGATFGGFGMLLSDSDNEVSNVKKLGSVSALEVLIRDSLNNENKLNHSVMRNQNEIIVSLHDDSLFVTHEWGFTSRGFKMIEDFAELLTKDNQKLLKNDKLKIEILGHYNDPVNFGAGNESLHKMSLSAFRASNVASVFVAKGVNPNELTIRGLSDSQSLNSKTDFLKKTNNSSLDRRIIIKLKVVQDV